jgi:hypothetical protein
MKPSLLLPVSVALGVLGAACASSAPPPNDEWSAAQGAIGRAEAVGAPQVPEAKLHLQLAREELSKGRSLIGNDNKRATTVIALAQTEAQLAASLAYEAEARSEAQQTLDQLPKRGGQ